MKYIYHQNHLNFQSFSRTDFDINTSLETKENTWVSKAYNDILLLGTPEGSPKGEYINTNIFEK